LIMSIHCASIRGMNNYVFNKELGKYEQSNTVLTGKTPPQIAEENNVTMVRARQFAREHKLPYVGREDEVYFYVFDAAAEEAFRNRKTRRGPKAMEKPPKVPGKIGRPRKEKPDKPVKVKKEKKAVINGPKRGRGRPRKKQ